MLKIVAEKRKWATSTLVTSLLGSMSSGVSDLVVYFQAMTKGDASPPTTQPSIRSIGDTGLSKEAKMEMVGTVDSSKETLIETTYAISFLGQP